jgi:hypothetical protein
MFGNVVAIMDAMPKRHPPGIASEDKGHKVTAVNNYLATILLKIAFFVEREDLKESFEVDWL